MASKEFVERVLQSVAEAEKIQSYELVPDIDILRGDGFLSEFFTGSVKNKNTGDVLKVYIKSPPDFQSKLNLNDVYSNECKFYLNIWPALDGFQREKEVKVPFDKLPKVYSGDYESKQKYLALENLIDQSYTLHNKMDFFNQDHLRTLFETYGKFHALTFTFKEQNVETFKEITESLVDIFSQFMLNEEFSQMMKTISDVAQDNLEKSDKSAAARIEKIKDNFNNIITNTLNYRGEYSTLTHGDCWSNNILFKFDAEGKVENLRLLDFQMTRHSTPVHDLSYFFYSGASKEDMDKLDEYLDIYHKSFSSFAKELGSDPEKLYPLQALKADWVEYSAMGMVLALMIWQVKFMSKKEISEFNKMDEKGIIDQFRQINENEQFRTNVSNIFLHAIERNFI